MTILSDLFIEDNSLEFRLAEFRIDKLFGEYDYRIPLNLKAHVTAIIAPNGTGKTLCLRMINSLFSENWSVFSETEYKDVVFSFTDGTSIQIHPLSLVERDDENRPSRSFELHLNKSDGSVESWKPANPDGKALPLERYIPFLSRISQSRWIHQQTGETLNAFDIANDYGSSLPESIRKRIYGGRPKLLGTVLRKINCRLIETQRLLILREPATAVSQYYGRAEAQTPKLAIAKKAEAIKEIISREINNYAALSQSLDRSFPRRVIESSEQYPQKDFAVQLEELDAKRRALMDAGILDTDNDEAVLPPSGNLSPETERLLNVYAEDTRKKLESLTPLLSKITLFKELIDERFRTKDVRISRDHGIDVSFHKSPISLENLSSGEQHQLVLFFEMLFEIGRSSLILIDEPELSLHVAWQKKFISDLMRIIALNKFDVMLATHSPQLVGRWASLVVELGDVYEGEIEGQQEVTV